MSNNYGTNHENLSESHSHSGRNSFTDLIHTVKNIPIEQVANRLGLVKDLTKQGNRLTGDCPTGHGSKSNACFNINLEHNFFNCFHPGCEAKGDTISLVQSVKDIGFVQAVLWLAQQFQIIHEIDGLFGYPKELTEEELSKRAEFEIRARLYERIFEIGKSMLFSEEANEVVEYLTEKRKYDAEKLKETDFIYFPRVENIKKELREHFSDLSKEINALKLVGYFGDNFRLAIPYRNLYGQITGFMKRATAPNGISVETYNGKKHENVRWDSTTGLSKDDLFGLYRCKRSERLVIVEGYPDALYLPTLGFDNVVAVGQGKLGTKHIQSLKPCGIKEIILAFDNDAPKADSSISPGSENTLAAIKLLTKYSIIRVYVIDPHKYGTHKDPDEFVRANGADAFQSLVDSAELGIKFYVREVSKRFDLSNDQGKSRCVNELMEFGVLVSNAIDESVFVDEVSKSLSVPKSAVQNTLKVLKRQWTQQMSDTSAERINSSDRLFPFLDSNTNSYAYYDRVDKKLSIGLRLEILEKELEAEGQSLPATWTRLRVVFDTHQDAKIDLERKTFNLFTPSEYMLLGKTKEKIDLTTSCPNILKLFTNLIPKPDERERYINWLAGILQTRDKQQTAWVFYGKPGAGKNRHLELILKPLFGYDQVVQVEDEQLKSQFNGWLQNAILIAFNEIARDNDTRSSVRSKIKAIITDSEIQINEKHVKVYSVRNYANCLFFSNEIVPLAIEDNDRRFNIVRTGPNLSTYSWFKDRESFFTGITSELPVFAQYLMNYDYDPVLAKTPIENEEKSYMQEMTMDRFEEFATKLKNGDWEWMNESQTDESNPYFGTLSDKLGPNDLNGRILKDRALRIFNSIYSNYKVSLVTLAKKLKGYGIESSRPGGNDRRYYFDWSNSASGLVQDASKDKSIASGLEKKENGDFSLN